MVRRDHDEQWDELALGHVLGGLRDEDASAFRGHLVGCPACRARVAELRSMASDLAIAEREERASLRLRTEVEARREPTASDEAAERARTLQRRGAVAGAVLLVLVLALAMWNAHLRTEGAELREVASNHARTLTVIGAGTVVPAETSGTVTGVVSVDGDRVAFSLAGLPTPDTDERLVVWVEDDDGVEAVDAYLPSRVALEDGRLAGTVSAVDARRFLVTIEQADGAARPTGTRVVEARLDAAG